MQDTVNLQRGTEKFSARSIKNIKICEDGFLVKP